MALARLVSLILRGAELVFATIIAGITGWYLHHFRHDSHWHNGRMIYTEVVAALSMFISLIWLIPFSWSLAHWPVDFFISVCWWVSFGLLVNMLHGTCGHVFDWNNIAVWGGGQCGKYKADEAFAFLSAVLWLASALVSLLWLRRRDMDAAGNPQRRRWYRRSYV